MIPRLLLLVVLPLWVMLCGLAPAVAAPDHGDVRVHDPMMIRQGHTYYVFSTGGGIQIKASRDMQMWHDIGTVFDTIPAWVTDAVGPITDLWAPDVSYFHGLYHLYYAGSQFGTNTSVIGLATNTTLDPSSPHYRWVDRGVVERSTVTDDFNAIDPSVTFDALGVPWLVFGSFWSGIKLHRLDAATGKLAAHAPLIALAQRDAPDAIEAPYIIYRDPYYYLFVSFDFCCRGAQSTYRIMVGRATRISGPYHARSGAAMLAGAATQILASEGRARGPGGESVWVDGTADWLVYHYYDALDAGISKLQLRPLQWTHDGWPQAGPVLLS